MSEIKLKPAHWFQNWETFNTNDWNEQEELDYTYQNEWHAVFTIQLGELVQSGVFDWSRPELDWSAAAYDEEQYKRICDYFIQRFMFREISITPPLEWFITLKRKLVYELMPKYMPLYERVKDGINPFVQSDEYYKERAIDSDYPETLLSANADYVSFGKDVEHEKLLEGNIPDMITRYGQTFKNVDELLLDDLEVMFISLYTSYVNGL